MPLLPGHLHVPQALRAVARSHQRTVYDALLRTAAETLLTLAADPQHLGARPAILAVLHTWTQDLRYHPHVHVLITGGGLALDGTRWVPTARPDFLFPGYVLSPVFRGKMRDALRRASLLDQVAPTAGPATGSSTCSRRAPGNRCSSTSAATSSASRSPTVASSNSTRAA